MKLNKYKNYMKYGLLELEQGSPFVAKQQFGLALEEAQKLKNKSRVGLAIFKLAEANQANGEYEFAKNLFEKAISIFKEKSKLIMAFYSEIGLAYLYMDNDEIEKAFHILENIDLSQTNVNRKGIYALAMAEILVYQKQFVDAENILKQALDVVSIGEEPRLHLYIKKAIAYAHFRNNQSREAVEEFKKECEECLRLAEEQKLTDEKMLIYLDVMFMEYEMGIISSSSRDGRLKCRKKLDNQYIRMERYHSVALEYITKKEYERAGTYFLREHRLYKKTGSLFEYGLMNNLGMLYLESKNDESAFKCYIRSGDVDKIRQISESLIENIRPDKIAGLFKYLLKIVGTDSSIIERTGVATALGEISEILPDELPDGIIEALLELVDDEYSFIRNRDIKRNALESLRKYIRQQVISESMVDKVIDKLVESSRHKVSSVREITAKCFNDFLNKIPVNLQEKVCNYLIEWFNKEDSSDIKKTLELAMANLANHFEDQWKSKFIDQLKKEMDKQKDSEAMELISYLAWLNQDIPSNKLEYALNSIVEELKIQANYSGNSQVRSYYIGTNLLINMKNKLADDLKQKLVNKMLLAFKSKYNLAYNKREIIQTISEILTKNDISLLSQIESDIYEIVDNDLKDIESGVYDTKMESSIIFDAEAEYIIVDCIFTLTRIYNMINTEDGYKKLNSIILKASISKKAEIRRIATRCFRDLPILDLESQLTLFSLLYDKDDVSAQAIQSVAELSDKISDKTVIKKIIDKLLFHADNGNLDNKLASAYAVNQLLGIENIPDDIRKKMFETKEKLSSDKFYRVRKEAKITIGG
jgi:tetratricopeptide (TPR) repeat protein